uniref:Uncharacterized protein n=1 Tax=Candidatus Kentrum sp. UNK TaxID=2126344 RepID=A0A451AQ84_9GAMM|nr:MAG: hypothetical protein BECKUNK1418G_GA0071005_12115 [Candidatus Kentron sp. UNK]VFK73004.1 MAG: hypothetical protein BECKUNK1418H_GA0071006_11569 [Candidatus Kentron sp. UNK]
MSDKYVLSFDIKKPLFELFESFDLPKKILVKMPGSIDEAEIFSQNGADLIYRFEKSFQVMIELYSISRIVKTARKG